MKNLRRPKFNRTEDIEFVKTLKARVAEYFEKNEKSRQANAGMVVKTISLLALYLVPLALIITGVVAHPALMFLMWVLMAFGMAGIGMSIMHDANHGSYSKNPKVNEWIGYLINIVGGSHFVWKIQHNVLHHSFTNIQGHDGDIDASGLIRLTPNTKRRWIHKFQAFYAWALYGIMTINWATAKDFRQIFSYRKRGLTVKGKGKFTWQVVRMAAAKIAYWGLLLALPMWLSPAAWWVTLIFFLSMHFIAGVLLSAIFQAAHIMPEVEYPLPNEDGKVNTNWFIHQLKTTCNFSPNSRIFSWFVGGLNYQIEHHLFPSISHVHYPKISSIVKKTAEEYGVPYHVHSNFAVAMINHFKQLWRLGWSDSHKLAV